MIYRIRAGANAGQRQIQHRKLRTPQIPGPVEVAFVHCASRCAERAKRIERHGDRCRDQDTSRVGIQRLVEQFPRRPIGKTPNPRAKLALRKPEFPDFGVKVTSQAPRPHHVQT